MILEFGKPPPNIGKILRELETSETYKIGSYIKIIIPDSNNTKTKKAIIDLKKLGFNEIQS